MSKDEKISKLSTENIAFQKENEYLKFENANLKRLIFGSKTERFVANTVVDNQGSLFAESIEGAKENPEMKEETVTEKISYERKKANS